MHRPSRHPLRLLPSGIVAACLSLCLAGCALPFRQASTPGAALDATRFPRIDAAVKDAIAARRVDSAAFHLERDGEVYERAYGPATTGAVYDAGELTEMLATAPAVLILVEQGKLALDAPITRYFPECAGGGRDAITVRHLLVHKSGLPVDLPEDATASLPWHGNAAAHALACRQFVQAAPGAAYRYSRIDGILLGQLVEKITGTPLDDFVQARVFAPLQMRDTGFLPLRRVDAARIAPARADTALRGVVLDATTRRMDGVSGAAGVFTTVGDAARFARMLLRGGALDGVRVLGPDSVRLLEQSGFGRLGSTGCVLWIAPEARVFHVLLSNRGASRGGDLSGLERRLAALAAQAGGMRSGLRWGF